MSSRDNQRRVPGAIEGQLRTENHRRFSAGGAQLPVAEPVGTDGAGGSGCAGAW